MGIRLLQPHSFTGQPFLSLLNPHEIPHKRSFYSDTHHYLGWNDARSTRRIRIKFEDELYTDDDDGFGFSGARKRREWWYNDDTNNWFDDDEEEEEEDEFWIFKVFRAFSWMVTAIGISLLLGTGPNAFIMALAVPLGQTALSLVVDKVWGTATRRPKPRRRTRKKPFVRPSSNRKEDTSGGAKGSYESWTTAVGSSRKSSGKRVDPFGGWDELNKDIKETPKDEVDELPKQQYKGKLSKTRRVRDTPMFLRLLIAVFPFLGSWTRFLF